MKKYLLAANLAYYLFGTTIYMGVLWALHFFWYPSWSVMTIATVHDHFILPTSAATRFFWVVVPLMFISGLIIMFTEWRKRLFWATVIAYLGIIVSSFVGQRLIIPINKIIAEGITDPTRLTELLQRWMMLNDVRLVTITVMWL